MATLRQVHPEMNAEQIIALAKKQAGDPSNWDRLKPVEGREYRGAGLPNALDAVLKDQAKPVIGSVEYSTDGTTWQPLAGGERRRARLHPRDRHRSGDIRASPRR